jgi:hypothetical protein
MPSGHEGVTAKNLLDFSGLIKYNQDDSQAQGM